MFFLVETPLTQRSTRQALSAWPQRDRPKARVGLVDLLDTLLISHLLMQHMIFFAYFLFMRLICQFFTYLSATRRCAHELSLFLPSRINYIGSTFLACFVCCYVLTRFSTSSLFPLPVIYRVEYPASIKAIQANGCQKPNSHIIARSLV